MGIFGFGNSGPGAGGFTGFFNGPAAYGYSGTTGGLLSPNASSIGATMGAGTESTGEPTSADMSGSLGNAPVGLFSGALPGGGMASTQSGPLGGGISGTVAGSAPLGTTSMGGHDIAPWAFGLGALGLGLAGALGNHHPQGGTNDPVAPFAFGRPAVQAQPMQSYMPYMHM